MNCLWGEDLRSLRDRSLQRSKLGIIDSKVDSLHLASILSELLDRREKSRAASRSLAPTADSQTRLPIRTLPAVGPRVETGPIAFGDDWPGVFIRGDNAAYYALNLRMLLNGKAAHDVICNATVHGLLSTLESSNLVRRT